MNVIKTLLGLETILANVVWFLTQTVLETKTYYRGANIAGLISPNVTYAISRFLAKIIPVPISPKVPNIAEFAEIAEFFEIYIENDPYCAFYTTRHNYEPVSDQNTRLST
jgi:hypothetical protein